MAAGAWAGLVGTVLGYPLDVVKGRMQTGKGIAKSGAKACCALDGKSHRPIDAPAIAARGAVCPEGKALR